MEGRGYYDKSDTFNEAIKKTQTLYGSSEWLKEVETVYDKIEEAEIIGILDTILGMDPRYRKEYLQKYIDRVANINIELAIVIAEQFGAEHQDPQGLNKILAAWYKKDPVAAFNWAMARPIGKYRREAMLFISDIISEEDPKRAVNLLESIGIHPEDLGSYSRIFEKWVRSDRSSALAYAINEKSSLKRKASFDAILEDQTGKPFVEIMKLIDEIPDLQIRKTAFRHILKTWHKSDVEACLNFVVATKLSNLRSEMLAYIFKEAAQKSPFVALNLLNTLNSEADRELMLPNVISKAVLGDKINTVAFIMNLPERERNKALADAVTSLAKTDHESALNLLGSLPNGPEYNRAISGIAKAMSDTDPMAALKFALKNNTALQLDYLTLLPIFDKLRNQDNGGTLEWIRGLPPGPSKSVFATSYLSNQGIDNAVLTIDTFDSKTAAVLSGQTAARWATENANDALKWATNIKVVEHQRAAMLNIGATIGMHNPKVAAATFKSLSPDNYDQAVVGASTAMAVSEPALAADLISQMNDFRLQRIVGEKVAESWMKIDRNNAQKWINTTKIFSETTKQRLLQ